MQTHNARNDVIVTTTGQTGRENEAQKNGLVYCVGWTFDGWTNRRHLLIEVAAQLLNADFSAERQAATGKKCVDWTPESFQWNPVSLDPALPVVAALPQ